MKTDWFMLLVQPPAHFYNKIASCLSSNIFMELSINKLNRLRRMLFDAVAGKAGNQVVQFIVDSSITNRTA